ncbi:MAG: hypothetical protein JXA89_11375 [Anaerolineae bacterium]|nr:hypothetical protein [Anaerolineae bacterium]
MMGQMGWIRTLSSISGILALLVVLAGLIVGVVAYFKGKSRVALLGAIGFLLLFLFSCCSTGWGLADTPILRNMAPRSIVTYQTVKNVILFLLSLVNVIGFVLLAVAVWVGREKKD